MATTIEKGLVSKSALTAIGDAIRAKNGSTTKYKPSEMAAAISNLKGGDITVATSDKFNFKVVQSANQVINSTPVGNTVSNSDGTVSLALTDNTTISPNTNYIPGTIQRSYDDSTHTYTVTATNAEPISGLVQDGWSVVYQKNPSDSDFYTNADYTGTANPNEALQGNILVGGMQSYSNSSTSTYPSRTDKILKFKNTFITSAGDSFLGNCTSLTYAELPNLTKVGKYFLSRAAITSVELPNLTKAGISLFMECDNFRSIELPKLTNFCDIQFPSSSISSPIHFIDCGYATDIYHTVFRYARVIILRAKTVQTNFEQSALSELVLYIVPAALVDTYKSKVRSGDWVTALEESPFADGKTVCGNNMKTVYIEGMDGETPDLGEGTMLWFDSIQWRYVPYFPGRFASKTARLPENSMLSGFYFLSKLTKEQGYTIPQEVPSGEVTLTGPNEYNLIVPARVNVIKVHAQGTSESSYVGVTPGTRHHLRTFTDGESEYGVECTTDRNSAGRNIKWIDLYFPLRVNPTYTLSWSPEINKEGPTVTDYD